MKRTIPLSAEWSGFRHNDGTGYTVEFKRARCGTLKEVIEAGWLIEEPER